MAIGQYNLPRIQTLQPAIQPLAIRFLELCQEQGVPCEIAQGTRTFDQQQAIYNQGRTAPGAIVTKAKPGDSYHQYGLAFDAVPTAYKSLKDWNPEGPAWLILGQVGESLGLSWGGRWADPDKPHFQFQAAPISELKAYWEKFKTIMPVTITPTLGGGAIILLIGLVYLFWLRPMLARRGYV